MLLTDFFGIFDAHTITLLRNAHKWLLLQFELNKVHHAKRRALTKHEDSFNPPFAYTLLKSLPGRTIVSAA